MNAMQKRGKNPGWGARTAIKLILFAETDFIYEKEETTYNYSSKY